jgi:hypothetical protein
MPIPKPLRLLSLALLVPAVAGAQADSIAESRAEFRAAVAAYQARDWPGYLEHSRRAQALRPDHGGVTYALASARALSGDNAGALEALRRFAHMGYAADLAADSDFVSLRRDPAYGDVARRLARNGEPLVRSRTAFTLPEADLLAEGIAYDPADGAFYVAAVHQRKILRVDPGGAVSVFAGAAEGLWAPMGMRVDAARRRLWVATSAIPQMRDYAAGDSGRAAVLAFDLRSGAPAGRYEAGRDGTSHLVGDLIVTRDGGVYATDSRAPVIYRVPLAGDTLERFVESGRLLSAQGLALGPDGRTLYLADYARGILRVDLATRAVTLLRAADSALVLGIDGLYWHRGGLVGIQNGVTPHRVVRLVLDAPGARVLRTEVLERAHPAHREPTLGVVVDDDLYYIANSQWESYGEDGRAADQAALEPTVVLRLRL